jgi:hypothetical protein
MSTGQSVLSTPYRPTFGPRLLGTLGMISAPMMAAVGIYHYFGQVPLGQSTQAEGVLGIIYIAGWMCTAAGMRWLGVTGTGTASTAAFLMQMVGLALAAAFSLQEIFRFGFLEGSTLSNVTDAAWPLSHLFMLAIGGLVVRAGIWKGWRRLAPFVCGLALPTFFISMAVGVPAAGFVLFPVLTAIGFSMLGYAVRTGNQAVTT